MRDVLHALATVLVIAVATLCTMVQVADAQHALDRLRHDDSTVQEVGHHHGPGTGADAREGGSTGTRRADLRP